MKDNLKLLSTLYQGLVFIGFHNSIVIGILVAYLLSNISDC